MRQRWVWLNLGSARIFSYACPMRVYFLGQMMYLLEGVWALRLNKVNTTYLYQSFIYTALVGVPPSKRVERETV